MENAAFPVWECGIFIVCFVSRSFRLPMWMDLLMR